MQIGAALLPMFRELGLMLIAKWLTSGPVLARPCLSLTMQVMSLLLLQLYRSVP